MSNQTAGYRDPVFAAVAEVVSRMPSIELAYVYGSFLRSKQPRDIDVAVSLNRRRRNPDHWGLRQEVSELIGKTLPKSLRREVDVHILQEMPLVLQHRIISEGRLVFARNERIQIPYEEDVLNSFLDFQSAYAWLNRQTLRRWKTAHGPS